jgi:protein-tyrosine phosphatase
VRDLGGLVTADGAVTAFGAVVRADNVLALTEAGWTEVEKYDIRTILDLRSAEERAGDLPAAHGFEVATVSLFDDFDRDPVYRRDLLSRLAGCDAAEQYRVLYLEALERNADSFAVALAVIANAKPGGVLVHCSGGKDRTPGAGEPEREQAGLSLPGWRDRCFSRQHPVPGRNRADRTEAVRNPSDRA